MDRGTLIRSYTAGDLGFILHSRHQYHWHTGYAPPQTVAAPHLGAIIARTLGPLNPAVPGVHQHRPALRSRRRRGTEGVHHRRLSRQRIRPVQHSVPRSGRRQRAAAGGHDAGPVRGSRQVLPQAARGEPDWRARQRLTRRSRCCARWTTRIGCSVRRRPRRSTSRSNRWRAFGKYVPGYQPGKQFRGDAGPLRRHTNSNGRTLRPRLPARAAAGRSRRALHRGDDRIHPVPQLGHARERPHATGGT